MMVLSCGGELVVTAPPEPEPEPVEIPNDPNCDPLVPEVCGYPFPSRLWLEGTPERVTGFTLAFGAETLPANSKGVHIDPAPYRRLDGYGVGVPALAFFPNLDPALLPDEDHVGESMGDDARVMMFEERDGALVRIPCFTDLDRQAKDDATRALVIRPAVLLREKTRYVAALRDLEHLDGTAVEPSAAFRVLRDGEAAGTYVEPRIDDFESMFADLEEAGVARDGLLLAWDWVTASSEAMHGPLLHMRDEAFAELGNASPEFTISSLTEFTVEQNPLVAYEVLGTFAVPDYTVPFALPTQTGYVLNLDPDGVPQQTGTYQAEFRARIPRSAITGEPHGLLMHGHGLNGTHDQIGGRLDEYLNERKLVYYGCNMIGMSNEDVPGILELLTDFSDFPVLSDRLHQAVLNHAFLVRGMRVGFDSVPEIAATGLVVDPNRAYYEGISQGGIYGGTHMAMSLDMTRGHLGVPGNNYSTLLQRSTNFGPFFIFVGLEYPDARDQQLILATIQNLWDSTDPVSHLRHVSEEPFPGTPPHSVILASAKADWQVANVTNEIAARSGVGVALMPFYGRDVFEVADTPYPHVGSGLVNYDFGNPWPAPGNYPPVDDVGDPHGLPRSVAAHNDQMFHFFETGEIIDTCGGDGCTPD
jgi:hypothetical protein